MCIQFWYSVTCMCEKHRPQLFNVGDFHSEYDHEYDDRLCVSRSVGRTWTAAWTRARPSHSTTGGSWWSSSRAGMPTTTPRYPGPKRPSVR